MLAECRRLAIDLPGLALAESLYARLLAQGHGRLGTQALVLTLVVALLLGLLPITSLQLTQLVQQFPNMLVKGQNLLLSLPTLYPEFITEVQILEIINALKAEIATWGQKALSWSL